MRGFRRGVPLTIAVMGSGLIGLIGASPALAVAPPPTGLPLGYTVQRVDSPTPAANGNFGLGFAQAGDLNGDGKMDLIVGTDEHGGSTGPVFEISGVDGSLIRSIPTPDTGGTGTAPSFGSYVGALPDIGSCAGGTPGATCTSFGLPDGTPDVLVSALGVDVGGLVDAGRGYVIDGATGGVLRRLDLPPADITEQLAAPGGAAKPALGRTILNPSSQFGAGNDTAAPSVLIGDMNGGGKPDVIVGASDYFETGATANPQSACAAAGPTAQCLQAGRAYVYYGETIAAGSPATPDNAPDMTIKNPAAQPDDTTQPVNTNRESFAYSVEPIGDVGQCLANPGPGARCLDAASNATADGLPDVAISSHRTDEFGMFDVGVVPLIDGKTGSVLYTYHHPEPQPASLFGFSNFNQPAIGDVGQGTAPDVYQAAMRQNNPYTGGGKGYFMNGNFRQPTSPNSISFATATDPTPHPSEDFGTSSAGIGNVFGKVGDMRNEVMIGAYGPHNPGTATDTINDVHIWDPIHEVELQNFAAPDQQAGLGFGTALAPLGDTNGDGFIDYAIGAGLYDLVTSSGPCSVTPCGDAGRIYIFTSDNTQPSGGNQAPVQNARSLTLKANKRLVAKKEKVKLSGQLGAVAGGAACTAGQVLAIERRSKSGGFNAIGQAETDSGGAYRASVKMGRTAVLRVTVGASASCAAASSPTVKVKVKK
jgi:hypothetical protein